MTYLTRAQNLEPDGGGAVVKFANTGDAVVARYVERETVKTKMGESRRLSVDIVESNIDGVEPGPAAIFESSHVTQIMDRKRLTAGQGFMLKLCDIDKKSRFKRFGFDRVTDIDAASEDFSSIDEPGADG
jgi:hypothetical protein